LTSDNQQHLVQLDADYYAGVFPVTQAQYEKIVGNYGKAFTNATLYSDHRFKPVSGLDWSLGNRGAVLFTEKTAGKLLFSLPTEAQWEFAARGGVTNNTLFSKKAGWGWGTLRGIAWSSENILSGQNTAVNAGYDEVQTVAVGRLAPNGFGLYDTLGNVLEACSDFSADSTYVWPDDEIVHNPLGVAQDNAAATEQGTKKRIFRGGSIDNARTYSTLRSRFSAGGHTQNIDFGFRVICTVP
jgi:formylglycine-generating enzyme required for sulfatase activity